MEEGDDGAFEFGASAGIDGCGGEGFPNDGFADVGGDEEGDAASQTVSFLEEFVKKDDDQAGDNQLNDEEDADTGT